MFQPSYVHTQTHANTRMLHRTTNTCLSVLYKKSFGQGCFTVHISDLVTRSIACGVLDPHGIGWMHQTRQCLLCGIYGAGVPFRTRTVAHIQNVLTKYIQETPFVWRYIRDRLWGVKQDASVDICAPCMQWMQRACNYASQRTTRYMLLVDQLVMYVMHPGRAPGKTACIQARVYSRILQTLRQPGNPLMFICPLMVKDIITNKLDPDHKKPLMHIMQQWWVINGSPEILPSAEVARAVRFYTHE